ncbi:DUF5320 domain-containing protein [Candidatus Riflebacteria bacterium]
MPGLNGTGPKGRGIMTGRGTGFCTGGNSRNNTEKRAMKNQKGFLENGWLMARRIRNGQKKRRNIKSGSRDSTNRNGRELQFYSDIYHMVFNRLERIFTKWLTNKKEFIKSVEKQPYHKNTKIKGQIAGMFNELKDGMEDLKKENFLLKSRLSGLEEKIQEENENK